MKNASISETKRQQGLHQVDEQRAGILEAAERLFLRDGLENTGMVDIAREAGITRVTLYRYFPNRDAIALEIQVRMLRKVNSVVSGEVVDESLADFRRRAQRMIRNFDRLRDAYRYIGMFDKIYLDNDPEAELTRWTKDQLTAMNWRDKPQGSPRRVSPMRSELNVVMSTIIWFLEKLALRGEITWSDQSVPQEEKLRIFEDMIMGYFERLMKSEGP